MDTTGMLRGVCESDSFMGRIASPSATASRPRVLRNSCSQKKPIPGVGVRHEPDIAERSAISISEGSIEKLKDAHDARIR